MVPAIVPCDKNGKDTSGVDYSRLTTLLIEAIKQQAVIHQQREQMSRRQAQFNAQQSKNKLQDVQITELRAQVKAIRASLTANGQTGSEVRTVKAQVVMLQE